MKIHPMFSAKLVNVGLRASVLATLVLGTTALGCSKPSTPSAQTPDTQSLNMNTSQPTDPGAPITPPATQQPAESEQPTVTVTPPDPEQLEGLARIVEHCDRLGFATFASRPKANIVFSPSSACFALGMLTAGASNAALTELSSVLGAEPKVLHPTLKRVADELRAFEVDPATIKDDALPKRPALHRANHVVLMTGFKPLTPFLTQVKESYDATISTTNLGSPAGKAILDKWVNTHTGGRIPTSVITPNPALRMVLQDAILFAAEWAKPFSSSKDQDTFHNIDGTTSQVPVMGSVRGASYAESDGWKAITLKYVSDFSALFVLPPSNDAVMNYTIKQRLISSQKDTVVRIQIPKLKLKTTTDLKPILTKLGAASIFSASTLPLEGISPAAKQGALEVSQIEQQAILNVFEAGTVAAAVTEIGIRTTMLLRPEKEFVLNRPFLMLIVHDKSGLTLFQTAVRTL